MTILSPTFLSLIFLFVNQLVVCVFSSFVVSFLKKKCKSVGKSGEYYLYLHIV